MIDFFQNIMRLSGGPWGWAFFLGSGIWMFVGSVEGEQFPLHPAAEEPSMSTNRRVIMQHGVENQKTVIQQGEHLYLRLEQDGDHNTAELQQSGDQNQATSIQEGDENTSRIRQKGSGNRASISQGRKRRVDP